MIKTLASTTLCTMVFYLPIASQSVCAAEHYDVYLLAGQSNMDGRGLVSELSMEQGRPVDGAIIFYRNVSHSGGGWQTLVPGVSIPPKYKGGFPSPTFGPEIGFARSMLQAKSDRKLALIKGSKGGTSLRVDWKPGRLKDDDSQGPCYRQFIETTQIALKELKERGDQFSIRGLLWHQGESDSKSSSDVYQLQLKDLIARVRDDLGVPDLPVVVGEVFDNGKRDQVRTATQAVAAQSPFVGLVTSQGTTTSDPGTHFDTKSQLLLGERYAIAMRELLDSKAAEMDASRSYPRFTWDRLPRYMHVRKAKAYTDNEIAFLAKFPLITFEKSNGHLDHGSIEAGTLAASNAVKNVNPDAKILYYRNVIVHYGGYDVNQGLERIEGALLHDNKGDTNLVRNRVQAYDLSNSNVRNWWVDSCKVMTADPSIDGLFIDGNIKALEPGYLRQQIGAEKKTQTIDGYHELMKQTREAIGPDKLMIGNILRARFDDAGLEYLNYFDGSYLEGFFHNVGGVSYEEYVAKGIDAVQKAARQGKIIAFTAGFDTPSNTSVLGIDESHTKAGSDEAAKRAVTYPLAVFLICAEEHSYFRIHEGYSADEDDRWMRWLSEYDRPLGPPSGPASKDGYRYTREFQHATVQLDIQKRTANIQWLTSETER